jgi:hypothetical protein
MQLTAGRVLGFAFIKIGYVQLVSYAGLEPKPL